MAALSPSGTVEYDLSLAESRTHVIVRGTFRTPTGFFGFLKRWFRIVRGFVLVSDKTNSSVQVRVNV